MVLGAEFFKSERIEIHFSLEAIRVLRALRGEFGVDPGYRKIGYLFLISDPERPRGIRASASRCSGGSAATSG